MSKILFNKLIITLALSFLSIFTTNNGMETFHEIIEGTEKTIHDTVTTVSHAIDLAIHDNKSDNPYTKITTHVRLGNDLCEGEHAFRALRRPKVRTALENLLQRDLQDKNIPIIAAMGSGGGYRAMLSTTGFLCGAKQKNIDLLDTITYIAGVSGSTWCMGPWYATGMQINKFKDYIRECAAKDFFSMTSEEINIALTMFDLKKDNGQPLTLSAPYGALLANRTLEHLGAKRQQASLSEHVERIKQGDIPYPIYTAIDGRKKAINNPAPYEFTPHEFGSSTFKTYIPTYGLGRKYKKGKSKNNDAPELTLGDIESICGSAFAADFSLIFNDVAKNIESGITKLILKDLETELEGDRPLPFYVKIRNPTYKMQGQELAELKFLKLVDAGLEANLPYSPVSGIRPERKADILLFLDSSAGEVGKQLQKAEEYAKANNLPFPQIDYTNIGKKTISVFKNEQDPSVPVVIYMPGISDKQLWEENKSKPEFKDFDLNEFDFETETSNGFCKTIHFRYLPEKSKKVTDQTQCNMMVNKHIILQAINWWIDQQKK